MNQRLALLLAAAVISVAALPCIVIHLRCEVLPEDDGFITYRYVENIAAGHGPVYNPGTRVFGTTTPLYTAWLTVLKLAARGSSTPTLAVRLNFLHYLACAAFLFVFLHRIGTPIAVSTAGTAFFLLYPDILQVSLGGMEPFLFLWLALAALALAVRGRPIAGCAVMGIATLVRPEGAVFLVALLPLLDRRNLARPALCAAAYMAPILLWTVPAWIYFGSPVPHSVTAKLAPLYPLQPGHMLISVLGEMELWLTRGRLLRIPVNHLGIVALLILIHVALLGLLASGAAGNGPWSARPNRRVCAVVAMLFLLTIGFYAVTNPLFCSWYMPQVFVPWIVFTLTGARGITAICLYAARGRENGPLHTLLLGLGRGVPLLLAVWMTWNVAAAWSDTYHKSRGHPVSLGRQYDNAVLRINAYHAAAEWLNLNAAPGSRVLSAEVGALGYYFDGFVIDACGLVSPEAVKYLPVPSEQRIAAEASPIRNELVRDLLPDYVVSMWAFSVKSIDESEWFRTNYRPAHSVPLEIHPPGTELWGGTEVIIHERR